MNKRITSNNITKLKKNEIFVFGSNAEGQHHGGAAKNAVESFGAIIGQGCGLQGKSFAINTMSGLDVIKHEVAAFIRYAMHADNIFLVTEIGCGIAGFKPEQIAPFFKEAKEIANIHLPESFWDILSKTETVFGFKGMDKDMKCRDFQYEVGKEYKITERPVRCTDHGFHFCENPLDIFNYYPAAGNRFFAVEGSGQVDRGGDDSKVAVSKIKIGAEISLKSIIDGGIKFIFERTTLIKESTNTEARLHASNSGYSGAASNSGYRGAASNSGDSGAASNSGDRGAASNSGDRGAASNSGDSGAASNSGYRGAASNSGDSGAASNSGYSGAASNSGYSGAASNSGDRGAASNSGYSGAAFTIGNYSKAETNAKESVAVAVGYENKAKASLGSWIVLAERNDDLEIMDLKSVKVDGEIIKADTFYTLRSGSFVETN
jgi:hypothetical protein